MTTKQTLIAARALIEKPERWTKFAPARNDKGEEVNPTHLGAVCFCAVGALIHITGMRYITAPLKLLAKALPENEVFMYAENIVMSYNDGSAHAEVMAMFDRAIEAAE